MRILIIIDHKIIIPYKYNSVYDIGSLDGKNRLINNFNSNSEETRNELIRLGVDSSRIAAVPGEKTYINRTLKSALAFRDWLKASKCTVKGINIISFGPHAFLQERDFNVLSVSHFMSSLHMNPNQSPIFIKLVKN